MAPEVHRYTEVGSLEKGCRQEEADKKIILNVSSCSNHQGLTQADFHDGDRFWVRQNWRPQN